MTLTLRTRLAAISTIVFGLLLAALSLVSYKVLSRRLDADVTERLTELTDGLHGYLRFDDDTTSIAFDPNDNDQAAFVHEAARYSRCTTPERARFLTESNGSAPLALHLTPGEVQAFRAEPRPFDIETEYGRLRISNSVRTVADRRAYLLQVGMSLAQMDGGAGALSRSPAVVCAGGASGRRWRLMVAVGVCVAPPFTGSSGGARNHVQTLARRLPGRGVGDELDQVVEAFNGTLGGSNMRSGRCEQSSAALAHELRTPLAALRGEIELASRTPGASPARRDGLASQMEEIDRLTRLIDHILTLARAESGQIRLTHGPVNLTDSAASLVEQLEPIAAAKSIDLSCEPSDAVVVQGDASWLERLLLNLVDNALKFTRENGRVVVRVTRERDAARIYVRDTGVGLSPADAQQVFERFFRADPARSPSNEGAGLGLSLVQWIAAQHRGTVTVQSRLGEGSTFTVTLPISRG